MQKVAFCVAICHLLDAERLPFTVQKVTFHNEAYWLLPYFQVKPRPEFVDFAIFFRIMERASMPFTVTFFNTNQSVSKVMVFILLIAFRQRQIVYSNTQYWSNGFAIF